MLVHQTKPFMTYTEQIELLRSRGMIIPDADKAQRFLERRNYYRLSGYWYPMRVFPDSTDRNVKPLDEFIEGASFDLVIELYDFDARLRHSVFSELDHVETAYSSNPRI